jgi:DNA (cytosine-5)-methyltransferase 1
MRTEFDLKAEGRELSVLNLYAGLGGNRKNWQGVKVTAVEMEQDIADVYMAQFPNDTVIIGDAHKYLLEHSDEFDFIWSSPPCQTHSRMMKATRHKKKRYTDMSLYQEILFLKHFFKGKWVIENVKPYYEPLIRPSAILGRHYFWSNFRIGKFEIENLPNFIQDDTLEGVQRLKDWLGIHFEGNIYYKDNHSPGQVLRNCVHPSMGSYVFQCAVGAFKSNSIHQPTLWNTEL